MIELDTGPRSHVSVARSVLRSASRSMSSLVVRPRPRTTAPAGIRMAWELQRAEVLIGGTGSTGTAPALRLPAALVLDCGPHAVDIPRALVQITVARPVDAGPRMGAARGFGLLAWDGSATSADSRTVHYRSAPAVGRFGFPATTFTIRTPLRFPESGLLVIPVSFGLVGAHTAGVPDDEVTFPVSAVVTAEERTLVAGTAITVPAGAGIL